jgi:hypothetical protein
MPTLNNPAVDDDSISGWCPHVILFMMFYGWWIISRDKDQNNCKLLLPIL